MLTIITICYNKEADIEETCKSIVEQTYQNFEWIVVDGGSTDRTLSILDKYKDRINVLISEKDNGRYNAMNKGIKAAKGKYLQFLNGGDSFYDKTALERIFGKKSYNADVLYADTNIVDPENNTTRIWTQPEVLSNEFFIDGCISHPSSFINKRLFEKFGMYDESYNIAADKERWVKFFRNNAEFRYIKEIVATFKTDGISSCRAAMQEHGDEVYRIVTTHYGKKEIDQHFDNRLTLSQKLFSIKREYGKKTIRIFGNKFKLN